MNVRDIMPLAGLPKPCQIICRCSSSLNISAISTVIVIANFLDMQSMMGVNIITMEKQRRTVDPKIQALREQGALNHHPERVNDPLFLEKEFFDARDVVQVKYEMVRRVETEGKSVTAASAAFGFSRPSFYQTQSTLRQDGLPGLIPKKRGPRSGHKLREEVVDFMESARAADRSLSVSDLAFQVAKRFGVVVHRRSIERALRRRGKKRLLAPESSSTKGSLL